MSEKKNKRAVSVGIFILIGVLLLVGGVVVIGDQHSTFTRKISVYSIFGDVNGVQKGDNIFFSGVKIGTVHKVEFYGESQVKVFMSINTESVPYIRKDAKVKISTDGFIGNKILVIYGGTQHAEEVADGDELLNEPQLSTDDILATLQKNNENILALTDKINSGEGTIGKLLYSDSLYNSLTASANSLELASQNAQVLLSSLVVFTNNLNKEGTLAHDLATDTVVFRSLSTTIQHLQEVADTAQVFANNLKDAQKNTKTPLGVLMYDEQAGASLKNAIVNVESSTAKLDEDAEAVQHNILLRRYFKKKAKDSAQGK
jgi:phospholipid/cholesterol/gamma-HCH transport system substrate-binding protein